MTKILLVDDEPALLDVGKLFIERGGDASVDTASSGAEALEKLSSCCYDAIVSDYDMPGMNGIELLKAVRRDDASIPFIIFTGKGREEVVIDAINHGADFYLQKGGAPGAQFAELLHKIRQGVRRRITEKRNAHLKSVLHAIRDVHHLITSEKDAESLMREIARLLVDARGYTHVWILLLDGEGRAVAAVEAGIGARFQSFAAMLGRGEFPSCIRAVTDRGCVATVTDPAVTCRDCPLRSDNRVVGTMLTPIEAGGRLLGVLSATLPRELAIDEEEHAIFRELGEDLAFALRANETILRRERAEAALKESEELYRAVFETTGTAMAILEDDRTIAYVNREMEHLFDYSREEVEGKMAWTALVPEDELDRMKECHRIRRLEPGTAPENYEFVFINRQGDRKHGFLTVSMIPGTRRSIVSVLDITGLKEARAALRESEEKFRSLSESSVVGIYVIRDGRFAYVNPAVSGIFGYAQEELLRICPYDLVHPDDRELVRGNIARRLQGEAGVKYAFRGITKGGEVRWFEVFGGAITYDGRPAVIGTLIDVTGHRETRQALRESERKYRSFVDNTTSGVVVAQDGRIRYANPMITGHLGMEPGGSGDISFDRYLHPGDLEYVAGMHRRRLAGEGLPENYVVRVIDRDGNTRMMAMNVSVIVWEGRPATLSFLTDITELETYRRDLERANKKLHILSDITRHDILNQLGAIRGYLSFIRADYPDDPARYVGKVEQASETIEHQISFTRDYQYMGVVAPEWQRIDRLIEQVRAETDPGHVDILVSTGPLEVYADPLFRKVVYNLLDNALRHGGGITRIEISFTGTGDGGIIRFEDDGAGIPDGLKEKVFRRGVGSNTGYGLFLVREILDITGMTIRETGTKGAGARFEISVPGGVCRIAR